MSVTNTGEITRVVKHGRREGDYNCCKGIPYMVVSNTLPILVHVIHVILLYVLGSPLYEFIGSIHCRLCKRHYSSYGHFKIQYYVNIITNLNINPRLYCIEYGRRLLSLRLVR